MSFAALLDQGRPLLADGATATSLFAMGLQPGVPPELWTFEHPDRIRGLHRAFVEAGADIVLTNTFGANARRLAPYEIADRVREVNAVAARHARAVADAAGRLVVVAGAVGPVGDLLAPLGPLTEAGAEAIFAKQIEGLAEGGADLVWIETMAAPDEMRAAARAATRVGLPYTLTASFDTSGRTMGGLGPGALSQFAAAGLGEPPMAIGANCGVGPSDLLLSIVAMHAAQPALTLIAKANAGLPTAHGRHLNYPASPDAMAAYARLAVDAGARIIGGCCGTSPAHLAAMHAALKAHARRPPPTPSAIADELGPPLHLGGTPGRPSRRRR